MKVTPQTRSTFTGDGELSPYTINELTLFSKHHYLPSNDPPFDPYSSDSFRMYEFKVKLCARGRPHDWTDCPFAHPGEKARRRDPRRFQYPGISCPDFRRGSCRKGDGCEYAHGVFEVWLHPAKYRTQSCKDRTACRRHVCFFAHTPEQLRLPSNQEVIPKSEVDEKKAGRKKEVIMEDGRVSPDFGWVWDLVK